MAVLHFTDAQREEQLLPGQEVAELALTHHASPLSWVSTGGSDGYFVNINLESVKRKLTNSHPFFNSPLKCHFPKETPSSEMAPVPPHHPLFSEYLVVFIQGTYHQHSYLLSPCCLYHGATFCLSCCCRHGPPRSPAMWLGCRHQVLRSLPFQVLPTPGCIQPRMGDIWPSALQPLLSVHLRGCPHQLALHQLT